jgi:putative transposase
LGTQFSGEAPASPPYSPQTYENPLHHQNTRRPITFTTVQWLPLFTRKPYFDILLDSLQFCRQHKGLKLHAYVILDNHLHLLAAADKLTDIIRDFKSYTAKLLIARLEQDHKTWVLNQLQYYKKSNKIKSAYQVWQEGFHPQQIISEEMLHQKADYLHHNPVRIGVVERPEDWLYSSAGDYAGRKGILELDALD